MIDRTLLAAAVAASLAVLAPAAPGQAPDAPPLLTVDYEDDSGWVANEGDARQVVISFPVVYEAVSSIRIHFSEVHLAGSPATGDGSILRLTSLLDGAVQTLNARHVAEWQRTSAYFNGNAVQVEVIASPGTGKNRVALEALEVGIPSTPTETQCGPTDDRLRSNDPRACRLLPAGCTAWLINDCAKCLLSAGHCTGGGGSTVQFNVPPSNPNGSLNFPPPEDQYSVDPASYQFLNSIDDWQYFGVFPNSVTGLTPFEAMGDAFDTTIPPNPAGNIIRITGYGVDSTPDQTFNQIQQTSVGPFVSNGTNLTYQADTQGGNSGSPIIWDEQDVSLGIHTNGGCTTGGSGTNNGTPITAPSLQAALANPLGVCAAGGPFVDLGQSLLVAPFTRPPMLTACGLLTAGSPLSVDLAITVPAAAAGTSMTAWLIVGLSELSVPFQGGVLVPNPDIAVPTPVDTSSPGGQTLPVDATWPSNVAPGTMFWIQYWVPFTDGGAVSGTLASNALELTAG